MSGEKILRFAQDDNVGVKILRVAYDDNVSGEIATSLCSSR